jgi:nitrogenase subunit NifH
MTYSIAFLTYYLLCHGDVISLFSAPNIVTESKQYNQHATAHHHTLIKYNRDDSERYELLQRAIMSNSTLL